MPTGVPYVTPDLYEIGTNQTLTLPAVQGLLSNDDAPDGETFAISSVNGAASNVGQPILMDSGAILTVNADGSLTYSPPEDTICWDSFWYTATAAGIGHSTSAGILVLPESPTVLLSGIADRDDTEGESVSIACTATSTVNGTLAYTAEGLPDGLSIDGGSGVVSGTLSPNASGQDMPVTVTVSDGTSSATVTFLWTVTSPILFSGASNQSHLEGDSVTLEITATTLGMSPLTYCATGLPTGLTIHSQTGAITGVISPNTAQNEWLVKVTATDGTYSRTTEFVWTVTSPLSVSDMDNLVTLEGETLAIEVSATGPGGLTYSATGLPPGVTIHATTGEITGTVQAGAASDSSYLVRITATNGTYSGTANFFWSVDPRISIPYIDDRVATVGDFVFLSIASTFPEGGSLDYIVTGLPPGLSVSAAGAISGTVEATTDPYTPCEITVTVSNSAYNASRTFRWTVNTRDIGTDVTAVSNQYTLHEGRTLTVGTESVMWPSLLANDVSASSSELSVLAVNGATAAVGTAIALNSQATLIVDAQGRFSYTPATGFNGQDTFEYTVGSAQGSATISVYLTVMPAQVVPPIRVVSSLATVIRRSLANWSGGTGSLTLQQLEAAIDNYGPNQNSERAAALAVLRTYVLQNGADSTKVGTCATSFGVTPNNRQITEASLKQFEQALQIDLTSATLTARERELGQLAQFIRGQYSALEQKADQFLVGPIAAVNQDALTRYLWGGPTPAELAQQPNDGARVRLLQKSFSEAIQQGQTGDCSFLSSLVGYTNSVDPLTVKLRIGRYNEPGRPHYQVTLYNPQGGATDVRVQEPTYAQRLLYGTAKDGALWVSLFESAYLKMRDGAQAGIFLQSNQTYISNYYQTTTSGEALQVAMKYLTGKSEGLPTTIGNYDTVKKQLEKFAEKPFTFTLCTRNTAETDELKAQFKMQSLYLQHAYAVVGYDPVTGVVILRNPHNNSNDPAGGIVREVLLRDLYPLLRAIAVEQLQ